MMSWGRFFRFSLTFDNQILGNSLPAFHKVIENPRLAIVNLRGLGASRNPHLWGVSGPTSSHRIWKFLFSWEFYQIIIAKLVLARFNHKYIKTPIHCSYMVFGRLYPWSCRTTLSSSPTFSIPNRTNWTYPPSFPIPTRTSSVQVFPLQPFSPSPYPLLLHAFSTPSSLLPSPSSRTSRLPAPSFPLPLRLCLIIGFGRILSHR